MTVTAPGNMVVAFDPTGHAAVGHAVEARRSRRPAGVGSGIACLLLGIYGLSPYVALWSIDAAIRAHDTARLSAHIDWSALDGSMKADTTAAITGPAPPSDDLPDFGSSFATTAVSNAIDTELNAANLLDMAGRMMPTGPQAEQGLAAALKHIRARFVAPSRFEARLQGASDQTPVIVHLKFEHWRWQITRLEMPQAKPSATLADTATPIRG